MESIQRVRNQSLKDAWQSIGMLIIDECSFLSPRDIYLINARLQALKESPDYFGGINIVFVGDLYQLPPVGSKLYSASLAHNASHMAF